MNTPHSILVVDDEPGVRASVCGDLKPEFESLEADNGTDAIALASNPNVAAVLLDITLNSEEDDGLSLIPKILEQRPKLPIVMLSGHRTSEKITEALKRGAKDYIPKPFDRNDLVQTLQRVIGPDSRIKESTSSTQIHKVEFIGRSLSSKQVRKQAEKAGKSDANVLINGPSGTGKEVVARYIHQSSENPKRPFVAINCAAIPSELIESMLFGHERGAFTGATEKRIGKFEEARGGDIFLDEISSMPYPLQAKLLRVLQEHEFEALGSSKTIHSEFRVIAASNRDLVQMVKEGLFREDLYFRLCVIEIEIPPLKERVEDIPLLINHYLSVSQKNKNKKTINAEARGALAAMPWPGNVRQLFNVLDGMVCLSERSTMTVDDIPNHLIRQSVSDRLDEVETLPLSKFQEAIDRYEIRWLTRALRETNGNQQQAAELLGMSRSSFKCRIRRLGINR